MDSEVTDVGTFFLLALLCSEVTGKGGTKRSTWKEKQLRLWNLINGN